MRYILKVDFYKKEHKTVPILLYQDDWGAELLFETNLDISEQEMRTTMLISEEEAYLIVKTPNTKTLRVSATKEGANYIVTIPKEMTSIIGQYTYQLRVREGGQLNTSPVFYYSVENTVFEKNSFAIVDDSIVDEIIVGEDSFIYRTKSGYEKTIWVAHETVISAEKMNKIENELEKLNLGETNGNVHIGSVAPSNPGGLWIDTKDENIEQLDRTILEEITQTIKEQRNLIDELYFINMNSLDAGNFEDNSADIELDGGVY